METWKDFFDSTEIEENDKTTLLRHYVRESNQIEGIFRTPSRREIAAHVFLCMEPELTVSDLCQFVRAVQPGAKLRVASGLNVSVGKHIPPPGGQAILYALDDIVARVNAGDDPVKVHHDYETLHPFTDGNGRSGRAIYLRQKGPRVLSNCFLTDWYYESLQRER